MSAPRSPALTHRASDGGIYAVTIALPPALVAMAHHGMIPPVLPSRGGADWSISGATMTVRPRSFVDPEADLREGVGFILDLIHRFRRLRKNLPPRDELRDLTARWQEMRRAYIVGPIWERVRPQAQGAAG